MTQACVGETYPLGFPLIMPESQSDASAPEDRRDQAQVWRSLCRAKLVLSAGRASRAHKPARPSPPRDRLFAISSRRALYPRDKSTEAFGTIHMYASQSLSLLESLDSSTRRHVDLTRLHTIFWKQYVITGSLTSALAIMTALGGCSKPNTKNKKSYKQMRSN